MTADFHHADLIGSACSLLPQDFALCCTSIPSAATCAAAWDKQQGRALTTSAGMLHPPNPPTLSAKPAPALHSPARSSTGWHSQGKASGPHLRDHHQACVAVPPASRASCLLLQLPPHRVRARCGLAYPDAALRAPARLWPPVQAGTPACDAGRIEHVRPHATLGACDAEGCSSSGGVQRKSRICREAGRGDGGGVGDVGVWPSSSA